MNKSDFGPDAELQAALALPYMRLLDNATKELLDVRNRFRPISKYYFRRSWLRVVAQKLRLAKPPDLLRYAVELQALRDEAWRIIEEAQAAFEAIATADVAPVFKQMAQLGYHQVYYDGNVIILMNEFVKRMAAGDPESARYFASMGEFSKKAHANLAQLKTATKPLKHLDWGA